MEEWRKIPDFEDYEASNFGNIRKSIDFGGWTAGRILRPGPHTAGYLSVTLRKNNKSHGKTVHSLVALCFLGERSEGMHINHKDGCKHNNCANNLEYCTPSQNSWHKEESGLGTRGEKNGQCKLSKEDVIEIRRKYSDKEANQYELARQYKVQVATINRAINKGCWAWLS